MPTYGRQPTRPKHTAGERRWGRLKCWGPQQPDMSATGDELRASYLVDYADEKYGELYGV